MTATAVFLSKYSVLGRDTKISWTELGQEGEDCWFGFNEVNTIPLQLQINFIELREDICGLWQALAYGRGRGGHCAMPSSDPKS